MEVVRVDLKWYRLKTEGCLEGFVWIDGMTNLLLRNIFLKWNDRLKP